MSQPIKAEIIKKKQLTFLDAPFSNASNFYIYATPYWICQLCDLPTRKQNEPMKCETVLKNHFFSRKLAVSKPRNHLLIENFFRHELAGNGLCPVCIETTPEL